jgi:flagellar biosynthesis/type III secretory pathway chaperone
MTFSDRLKGIIDQGVAVSKDLAAKAGAKAQDLGERGVMTLEIKQLEGQAQKLIARLGNEAYRAFVERGIKSLSSDTAAVKTLLAEIASVRESIEKREKVLAARYS